ncbi:divergent PAP2 family protein [bacterium]|nr:divergent PAP2 family protein [bacterium]
MIDEINQLLINKALMASILGWFMAQTAKAIFLTIKSKRFRFNLYSLPGGFPSSHTATCVGLVTAIGLVDGFNSSLFAISVILAVFIIYDAKVIRVAAGKQAQSLNKVLEMIEEDTGEKMEKLKEILGHSLLEILCGGLVGILAALIVVGVW